MTFRHSLAIVLGVALAAGAVAACGTDSVGEPADPSNPDPSNPDPSNPDVTPPTVLSMTPADGATKLKDDVKIVITFSEPMDKAATEGAFSIDASSKTSGPPAIAWNEEGTVLTVDPKAQYTTGDDPATTTAVPLKFALAATATDLAGNSLTAGASANVSLYRQFDAEAARHATLFGNSADGSSSLYSFIGAGEGTGSEEARRGYVSFVLPVLPDGAEIHQATLEGEVRETRDAFIHFGDMHFEHVTFDKIDETTYGKPALSDLGVFIAASPAPKIDDPIAKDVTIAVADDYANGRELSQYRLLFKGDVPKLDGTSDLAHIKNAEGEVKITLSYLVE